MLKNTQFDIILYFYFSLFSLTNFSNQREEDEFVVCRKVPGLIGFSTHPSVLVCEYDCLLLRLDIYQQTILDSLITFLWRELWEILKAISNYFSIPLLQAKAENPTNPLSWIIYPFIWLIWHQFVLSCPIIQPSAKAYEMSQTF